MLPQTHLNTNAVHRFIAWTKLKRTPVCSVVLAIIGLLLQTDIGNCQYSRLDPFVRPVQGFAPLDSGVTLQGIQPFDPYANAGPGLPPPINSSAYPAPPGPLATSTPPPQSGSLPPYTGPLNNGQYGTNPYGPGYQPLFNFGGGGLYGGFQAPILEPRMGSIRFASTGLTLNHSPNFGLSFSPRIIVGYEGPQGLGIRGRWWNFDDSQSGMGQISVVAGDVPVASELDATSWDLELTQDGKFHNWEFLVSGGVRYAELSSSNRATWEVPLDSFYQLNTSFDGVGPTIGMSARRAMRQWEGLTFVVNSRFSFLFGDIEFRETSSLPSYPLVATSEDVMPIWDLQIGAQWTRRTYSGATVYIGAFFESQLWDWEGPSLNSDLGFWGPTFAVGFSQ